MDTGRFSYADVAVEVRGEWQTVGRMPFFLAEPRFVGVHRRIVRFYDALAQSFRKRAARLLADYTAEREAADGRTRATMREPRMTVLCDVTLPTDENGNRLTLTVSVTEWHGARVVNRGVLRHTWDARRGVLLPPNAPNYPAKAAKKESEA